MKVLLLSLTLCFYISALAHEIDIDQKIEYLIKKSVIVDNTVTGVIAKYFGISPATSHPAIKIYCHKVQDNTTLTFLSSGIEFFNLDNNRNKRISLLEFNSIEQCKLLEKIVKEVNEDNPISIVLNLTKKKFAVSKVVPILKDGK